MTQGGPVCRTPHTFKRENYPPPSQDTRAVSPSEFFASTGIPSPIRNSTSAAVTRRCAAPWCRSVPPVSSTTRPAAHHAPAAAGLPLTLAGRGHPPIPPLRLRTRAFAPDYPLPPRWPPNSTAVPMLPSPTSPNEGPLHEVASGCCRPCRQCRPHALVLQRRF